MDHTIVCRDPTRSVVVEKPFGGFRVEKLKRDNIPRMQTSSSKSGRAHRIKNKVFNP
jgi:hypothetical protein